MEAGGVLLVTGLALAAVTDVRTREVSDRLWQLLGLSGSVIGGLAVAPGGLEPLALWTVTSVFVLQHVFGWDELLGEKAGHLGDAIELGVYVVVFLTVGFAYVASGIGPNAVPGAVVAVVVTVLFARVLFETGVLYGGADAKAIMIAGLLVPFAPALLGLPETALRAAEILPFAVNVLMNAALLSVAIPIAVGARNIRRHEFDLAGGFTTYTIPVEELPRRYVWVRDPAYPNSRKEEAEVETSEQDRAWRTRIAGQLRRAGQARVRVSPQLPFLVLLCAGAIVAFLAGNLVLDLLVVL